MNNYDIIGFTETETKTDDSDDIHIPGFVICLKNTQTIQYNIRWK